ncbi:MAG: hypothetical protein JO353_09355 [Phycisphaerae bacterium]|nr:hypothetical protein [Phycisphaerae bacterium]
MQLIQNRSHPAEWFLIPVAIAGFGLLMRTDRRWGLLLLAWLLPALGLLVIQHTQPIHGRTIAIALPACALAAVWLVSHSAITAGVIVAMAGVMSVQGVMPRIDVTPVDNPPAMIRPSISNQSDQSLVL